MPTLLQIDFPTTGCRLEGFGITGIGARVVDVNESLTAVARGPLA